MTKNGWELGKLDFSSAENGLWWTSILFKLRIPKRLGGGELGDFGECLWGFHRQCGATHFLETPVCQFQGLGQAQLMTVRSVR